MQDDTSYDATLKLGYDRVYKKYTKHILILEYTLQKSSRSNILQVCTSIRLCLATINVKILRFAGRLCYPNFLIVCTFTHCVLNTCVLRTLLWSWVNK